MTVDRDRLVEWALRGDKLGAIKKMRELTGVEFEKAREIVAGL
jgi:ribosomal protein L7/L12